MDIETIVRQIEKEMNRQLVTQSEVAAKAGLPRQRVHAVLKRRSKSIPTIRAMREALGIKTPPPEPPKKKDPDAPSSE